MMENFYYNLFPMICKNGTEAKLLNYCTTRFDLCFTALNKSVQILIQTEILFISMTQKTALNSQLYTKIGRLKPFFIIALLYTCKIMFHLNRKLFQNHLGT
eukprot:NODE_5_length_72347_cov_1.339331.p63 type:complete len:101 gc:universal NODE_5_length_72347_cov_1.339331:54812-54510(-)